MQAVARPMARLLTLAARSIIPITVLLVAASLTILVADPTSAQAAPRPNVAVLRYEPQPSTRIQLEAYAPGSTVPQTLHTFDKGPVVEVSPDLKWEVAYGFDVQAKHDTLHYGQLGGTLTQVSILEGFSVLGARISADGQHLAYTIANPTTLDWSLGLVKLDSGQIVEFTSKFNLQAAPPTNGVLSALSWSADRKRLIVMGFRPFTEGSAFGGIYALDLAGVDFAKPGRIPLPALTPLVASGTDVTQVLVSPDGSRLAYFWNNPANPPKSYNSGPGPGITVNTLGLVDLNAAKPLFNAQAGPGQAFETMTWTPDSQKVLLTAGFYNQTSFLVTPTLIIVDIPQTKVSQGPQLNTDPKAILDSMLACGSTLFFKITYDNQGVSTPYLYSAPLADLNKRSDKLTPGADFRILTCAA